MITKGLICKPEMVSRNYRAVALKQVQPKQKNTARDRIPHGPTALIVLLFDLLIKLDPR